MKDDNRELHNFTKKSPHVVLIFDLRVDGLVGGNPCALHSALKYETESCPLLPLISIVRYNFVLFTVMSWLPDLWSYDKC